MAGKLKAKSVESAKAGVHYDGQHGLMLVVGAGGAKSWVQRIVIRGKRCDIGLGSAALVSLSDARDKAIDNRKIARAGGDPLAARKKADAMPTFAEAMAKAHAEMTFGNPKDGKAFLASLNEYVVPRFGSVPVCDVTGRQVREAVMAIRAEKPEVARKLVLRCSAVFKWAIGHGYRPDNPSIASVLALPKVPRKAQIKSHRKALPYAEVHSCIDAVRASGAWAATKLAIEFTILTASRSGEVRGAMWDEIDLAGKVWRVPPARMKMGVAHEVPLSPRAIEILKVAQALRDESGLVFPSVRGKVLSDATMSKLVKALGFPVDVHGFRTSFRTWAQEQTNFPFEVCEQALAHAVGDAASRAYARSDLFAKRAKLMDAWASYIAAKRCEVVKLPAACA